MPFTLEAWNTLISKTLFPDNDVIHGLNTESITELIDLSAAEKDRVRIMFLEGILERKKIRDNQQYVKINQAMLIRLLDKLYFYRQHKNLSEGILLLYAEVSQHLESTLDFIEDFFGNYFDRNEKVPSSYLAAILNELSGKIKLLEEAVQPNPPYINAIGNILADNFKAFCEQKKKGASYNELIYQKELMNQLLTEDTLASENSIKEVLSYFNYNDENYVAYLFEKFALITQQAETKIEKIGALRFEQKKFNQLPVRLDVSLSVIMPSLSKQVNQWIEEEIKFLEIDATPVAIKPAVIPVIKEEKYFQVPFKGTEIYLLLKSFIDSGGAPAETYKSLFEKAGARLSNKSQQGFSTESLQKASDKINYAAKENVKRFLQKMMRNVDSY